MIPRSVSGEAIARMPEILDGTTTPASVLQYHADLARDGVYVDAALTRAAVATLHRDPAFAATIEGAAYAQPLYVEDPAGHDVIVVATEENRVYALDAAS